jgi:hypothetical protein
VPELQLLALEPALVPLASASLPLLELPAF